MALCTKPFEFSECMETTDYQLWVFLERKRHFGMILNHQTDHIHKILFISRLHYTMNSPCLLVKSVALAEKGNKCNKNRCSRPAPNFGSMPHSQSSMHDGLRWNGETARSLRLRNRNPISVALNAYDNPSPPPHLSVLNYLQMSFKNQFIGVFFHNFGRKL